MCRASQGRQACPEEAQEPSSDAAKEARFDQAARTELLTVLKPQLERPAHSAEARARYAQRSRVPCRSALGSDLGWGSGGGSG